MVSSNPCVGPSPRTNIYFFLLSKSEYGKSEQESKPILYPEYEYLLISAFLINLTSPSKQYFRVKPAFRYCDHLSNS